MSHPIRPALIMLAAVALAVGPARYCGPAPSPARHSAHLTAFTAPAQFCDCDYNYVDDLGNNLNGYLASHGWYARVTTASHNDASTQWNYELVVVSGLTMWYEIADSNDGLCLNAGTDGYVDTVSCVPHRGDNGHHLQWAFSECCGPGTTVITNRASGILVLTALSLKNGSFLTVDNFTGLATQEWLIQANTTISRPL